MAVSVIGERERLACLIAGRNLGDIAIWSGVLRELAASGYARGYLVWTRPHAACMFEGIPNCLVVTSSFPVGTTKQFGPSEMVRFLRAAAKVRAYKPSVVLDLVGDFRERAFARLVGGRHVQIGWQSGHPYSRLTRNPFGRGRPFMTVPAHVTNVYQAYRLAVHELVPPKKTGSVNPDPTKRRAPSLHGLRIGLHPFASKPYNQWPDERWAELADRLLEVGDSVMAFGAPGDKRKLDRIFERQGNRIEMFAGSIREFAAKLADQDLIIGLNSFSVHMAHRQGVRSIMINAGDHPDVWGPPDCIVLATSGGCPTYPCFNTPRCKSTAHEYTCLRSISVPDVMEAVTLLRLQITQRGLERTGNQNS